MLGRICSSLMPQPWIRLATQQARFFQESSKFLPPAHNKDNTAPLKGRDIVQKTDKTLWVRASAPQLFKEPDPLDKERFRYDRGAYARINGYEPRHVGQD